MKLLRPTLLLFFALFAGTLLAQNPSLEERFKRHVVFLAADGLEGREAGTSAERVAADYLAAEFKAIGLVPGAQYDEWFHEFHFLNSKVFGPNNRLTLGGKTIKPGAQYYPILHSPSACSKGKIVDVGFGISAPQLGHDDYKDKENMQGCIFLMEISSPDGIHPHSKYKDYSDLRTKLKIAREHGASAVILMNSDSTAENPSKDFSRKVATDSIPVVFWTGQDKRDLVGKKAIMEVEWTEDWRIGLNVVGRIDNGAPLTVIIGGHYDHLGWGDEGSLHRNGRAIHNGADDNASGTAMVVELARTLKARGSRQFNYLFLCFSGEEKGLLGSSAFAKDTFWTASSAACMLNFDMVGRMDNDNYTLGVNGVGTATGWLPLVNNIHVDTMHVKTSESGVGPSDHTSFYFKNVPALHFFSGTHPDYHKPSDDESLINYPGMVDVHDYVFALIDSLSHMPRLQFQKTKEGDTKRSSNFSVTLGVVPDYLWSGGGMKVDGVTEGKPAAKAGIQSGDIVMQLGAHAILDMQGYMQALGKFKKGDKTTAKVKRGAEILELPVEFF
jgi:aminopeptidase YwaD